MPKPLPAAWLSLLLLTGCDGELLNGLAQALLIAALIALALMAFGAIVEGAMAILVVRRFAVGKRVEWPVQGMVVVMALIHGAVVADLLKQAIDEDGRAGLYAWIGGGSLAFPVVLLALALAPPAPPRTAAWYQRLGLGALLAVGAVAGVAALLWPWTEQSVAPAGRVTQVVSGNGATCVRTDLGEVACWGDGSVGQLGVAPRPREREHANRVPGLGRVALLVGGRGPTCALGELGLRCWGSNADGAMGPSLPEIVTSPSAIPELGDVVEFGTGGTMGQALWARERGGRLVGLGTGLMEGRGPHELGSLPADTVETVVGDGWWCARRGDGAVSCAAHGGTSYGAGVTARDLAGSEHQACVVLPDGGVTCWDPRIVGILHDANAGSGVPDEPLDLVRVVGLSDATQIAASQNHFCAITGGGEVLCWGTGFRGQLGDGSADDHADAQRAPLPARAVDLQLSEDESCARTADQRLFCWGDGPAGAPESAYTLCHETWLGDLWCVAKPVEVTLLP